MSLIHHRLFVIRFLSIFGLTCIGVLWAYESWAGITTIYDQYAYPVLFILISGIFLLSLFGESQQKLAEFVGLFAISIYFLGATLTFYFDPEVDLYIIANTMQWIGVVITAFFVVFTGPAATLSSAILLLIIYSPLFLRMALSGFDYWKPGVVPIVFNSAAIDVAILVALTTIQKLRTQIVQSDLSFSRMKNLAHFDKLTGARTRAGLDAFLTGLDDNSTYLLILIDVDNLKMVNDSLGHEVGDKALSDLAENILQDLREGAALVRWGGDEFVLIASAEQRHQAFEHLQDIQERTSQTLRDIAPILSISIGAVNWNVAEEDFSDRFRAADELLYEAKRSGKSRVVYKG